MTCYSACLLIAGFATNPVFLDVFCGLVGLCSAASVPAAIGTLGAAYPRPSRRKNIAFACFSSGNPLGFGAGALLSGFLNRSMPWRASFWTLAVIYGLVAALSWWTVPPENDCSRCSLDFMTLTQLDWLGAIAIIAGLALLLSGITLAAAAPYGWSTNYIVAFISFGIILIIAFVVWQAIISFGYAAFSSNMFFLALFLQKIRSMSPLLVAVHLLPQVIGGILVNIIAGLLMHYISNKILISVGAVCYVLAFTLLSVMQEDSSYWAFIFPALCLSVVGADFEFTVTNMYVMSSLPLAQQSVAGGLFNTVMRLSSSVGFAVSTAVFNGLDALGVDESNLSSAYGKYRATFFVSLASSGLSLFLLPFLTLKSQGGRSQRG
ncbi:hypothetical protein EPUS_00041 [Endocarpon pusillum Z07020]|uniref:Major facilitator superfamily (MFS) profile domain-containing protein n=1 Tax=Endocarpon pusillum (strain Z07020 / HMAS-L-300199) TaxID=1263415 RepID=U1I080_ENDPU|nr:uncharacterized protein EPUS_00041 [Endocarpon pusillum Z07020]ERF75249.1 hypothetical protein EPUS_00041 [Endocarpon pusillum Z07020]